MTVRPFRSAADTRQRPAARVNPVLTPIASSYRLSRRLWLTSVRPAAVQAGAPGVRYRYYEGTFSQVADIAKGRFVSQGTMPEPSIAGAPEEDHFGYVFEGMIRIPERGVWEFMTKSDDGSVLFVGGRRVRRKTYRYQAGIYVR